MNNLFINFRKNPKSFITYCFRLLKEKVKGIDILQGVNENDLGIPLEKQPYHYSASGNKFLKRVLLNLKINSDDSIIDIGCGKGGAIITMTKFPFKEIAGIEYSENLATTANNNIKKLKFNNVTIYKNDASLFSDFDRFNYIYMYNPFGPETMKKVMLNLSNSYLRRKRNIKIIYKNPELHELIIETQVFEKVSEFESETIHKFYLYETRENLQYYSWTLNSNKLNTLNKSLSLL